jgi:DNA-binding transcriptional LysR family regulator
MQATNYNDLALLVQVARAGTLTAAARDTGIPKSTISRRLIELEERLAVPLLRRGARQVQLTAAGERLVGECGPLLARLEAAETTLTREGATARGSLRVSCPGDFGIAVIAPLVEAFALQYPDITVEVAYQDRVVDLVAERFDLAVRVGTVTDPTLVTRTVGSIGGAVVASPLYIARRGVPSTPEDLLGHDALVFTPTPFGALWKLTHVDGQTVEVGVQHRLATNSLAALLSAARAGLGVARLPDYLYEPDCRSGQLLRLLPEWSVGARKVHLAWPEARQVAPAHRTFVDFVAARLKRP